jgi:hypothetical protein
LGLPVVETYHTFFEEYFHHYAPFLPGWTHSTYRASYDGVAVPVAGGRPESCRRRKCSLKKIGAITGVENWWRRCCRTGIDPAAIPRR